MESTYQLAADDPDEARYSTFDYRRIYLTADADLDEAFSSRVRLEMTGNATLGSGRPTSFVKDAWVRSSRDFGLRADGQLAGPLSYGLMVANGNGIQEDDGGTRGKRVYGQLAARQSLFRATVGLCLGYTDERGAPEDGVTPPTESSARASAFGGYVADGVRLGAEAFCETIDTGTEALGRQGNIDVSALGSARVAPRTEIVARYDFTDDVVGVISQQGEVVGVDKHFLIGALAYRPFDTVWIMPNAIALLPDNECADVRGRLTVEFRF